jgi:hypothetical protein
MATRPHGKKTKRAQPRSRYQLDIPEDARARWEAAAAKLVQPLASFIRGAVEEKIRRDGLG